MSRISTLALTCAAAGLFIGSPASAQDSDADGVPDSSDFFPCDPALAGVAFAPAEGVFGTLMFEDLWPDQGDLDFNDLVLAHNYIYELAADGSTTRLTATYDVRALGGTKLLGLGLHLPVPASSVASVKRTVGGGSPTTLTPTTLDMDLTVVVSSDLRELFNNQQGAINSDPTLPAQVGQRIVVTVDFAPGVTVNSALAPHDVYIFRSDDPGHEIHLPQYPGSGAMKSSLFGQADDGSSGGRFFIDYTGLPFALDIPQLVEHPLEFTGVSSLYPDIVGFASSGGTSNQDFYSSTVQASFQYRDSLGQPAPTPVALTPLSPDASCVNVTRQSCAAFLAAGNTTSGMYTLDPDGAGGNPAFSGYCDMTTLQGGWTECTSIVNTSADDLSCSADSGWFDNCVAFTQATWSGAEVMLSLTDANGIQVYAASGTRSTNWTTSNLTTSNAINSQYNRGSQHPNFVALSDGNRLSISGYDAGNQGWGGSWGNGYGVVVQSTPDYARNNVVAVMTRLNSSPSYNPCNARSLGGFTSSHEVMYSASSGISTYGGASLASNVAFLGTFRFFVR